MNMMIGKTVCLQGELQDDLMTILTRLDRFGTDSLLHYNDEVCFQVSDLYT